VTGLWPYVDDLSRFCCLNPEDPDPGKRGCGNLTVRARYGKHKRRLLYRKSCKARFSERKGTPLFDCRLGDDQATAVLAHRNDGRAAWVSSPRSCCPSDVLAGARPTGTRLALCYTTSSHRHGPAALVSRSPVRPRRRDEP